MFQIPPVHGFADLIGHLLCCLHYLLKLPLQSGTLAYNYHQPIASLDIDLARNFAWHAVWNYHQYGEKDFVGPTSSRYFHADNVTLALKYAL